jgi:hypothetical protein
MHRPIIFDQAQARDYDVAHGWREILYGLGQALADLLGQTGTVVSGLAATQTGSPSLTINIAAGDIYQLANVDTTAYGPLLADTTQTIQQGFALAQTVLLTTSGLAGGQSRYALITAAFSQADTIPADDPNGGILNYLNASNPSGSPWSGPANAGTTQNTRRQGLCTIGVTYGTVATTGSEVPPNAPGGTVGLFLIDLAFGQTTVTNAQIKTAGPSVGTGVPGNYPVAPFLAGLLNSHHGGTTGQAPKILLTGAAEVQGILPATNYGPLAAQLATGTNRTCAAADVTFMTRRSNSGTLMVDTLPGTSPGVLPAGTYFYENADATAPMLFGIGSGAVLDNGTVTIVGLGPGQRFRFFSDGANYWTIDRPAAAILAGALTIFVNASTGNDSTANGSAALPFLTLQAARNFARATYDLRNSVQITFSCTGAFTAGLAANGAFAGQPGNFFGELWLFASGASVNVTNVSCFITGGGAALTVAAASSTVTLSASGTGGGGTQGFGLLTQQGGTIQLGPNVTFGACAVAPFGSYGLGFISIASNYAASGNGQNHLKVDGAGGSITYAAGVITATLTGTPAYSTNFAFASELGLISAGRRDL